MRSSRYCHNYTWSHSFVNGHAECQANCVPAPRTREKSAEFRSSMKMLHVHAAAFARRRGGRRPAGLYRCPCRCRYRRPRPPSITPGRLRSCGCLSLAGAVLGLFDERRDIRMQGLQVRFMRIDHVTGGVKMHIDIALKAALNR
jgi:hypothetical protein